MTNPPPNSRVKGIEMSNPKTPGFLLNKIEDLNNIVVMSGSAKRRRLETEEKSTGKNNEKNNFKENSIKLRAPFCKPHHKQAQTQERLMTKSCEVLLECIKPYKEIRVARKTQVTESTTTFGSILTTDVVYERKATRKFQYVSFSEADIFPVRSLLTYNQNPMATASAIPESTETLLGTGCEDYQEVRRTTKRVKWERQSPQKTSLPGYSQTQNPSSSDLPVNKIDLRKKKKVRKKKQSIG